MSEDIPCPGWGGNTPYEQYRLAATLWEQVASLPKAKRAPALILKLSGIPEKMMQQHVTKITSIKDEGYDHAMPRRVKRFLGLLGDEYEEDAAGAA